MNLMRLSPQQVSALIWVPSGSWDGGGDRSACTHCGSAVLGHPGRPGHPGVCYGGLGGRAAA